MMHWLMSSHLTVMHRLLSSHLTVMTLLMMLNSVHATESLIMSRLNRYHSFLHLFLFQSFSSFLLGFDIFLPLLITFIKHVTNFSNMVNFGISRIKFVIFICTLHQCISSLFLGHLSVLLFNFTFRCVFRLFNLCFYNLSLGFVHTFSFIIWFLIRFIRFRLNLSLRI